MAAADAARGSALPRATIPETRTMSRIAISAAALLLALQASLAFTHAINWDEFWFYSQVVEFNGGDLNKPLQTLHVHLFQWLPLVSDNAVTNIVAGRIVMLGFELVTLLSIRALALRFGSQTEAWFTVLLYLSAGFVFQHGFAFRTDPMVTALLMLALAMLATTGFSVGRLAVVSLLGGLAATISIKAVLYLPCFAALALMRVASASDRKREWIALGSTAAGVIIVFALVYLWHSSTLLGQPAPVARAGATSAAAADHMFFLGKPPNLGMVLEGLLLAMAFTGLIALTPFAIFRPPLAAAQRIGLIGLLAPILTLAFYRNAASYYFVFMLAPVAVGCIPGLRLVLARISASLVAAVLISMNAGLFLLDNREVIERQKAVVAFAQASLKPSAYFDHPYMLSDFTKRNGFMMPAGMGGYRASGVPAYRRAMEREPVPLLLENWWVMSDVIRGTDTSHMLPADVQALQQNFVEWHSPLWLAGKIVRPANSTYEEEFLTPGLYEVQYGTVEFDGATYAPGSIIRISRGSHRIRSAGSRPARLIWADRRELTPPARLDGPLWVPL